MMGKDVGFVLVRAIVTRSLGSDTRLAVGTSDHANLSSRHIHSLSELVLAILSCDVTDIQRSGMFMFISLRHLRSTLA